MVAKLFVILALAAVAQCIEYPAGVHPAVCPNYPYCDTAMLTRYTIDGLPIPEWVYNPYILPAAPLAPAPIAPVEIDRPVIAKLADIEAALKHPAGLDPILCPNYPYCDAAMLVRHTIDGRPIPAWYDPRTLPLAPLPAVVSAVADPATAGPVVITKAAEPTLAPLPPADKYPADFDSAKCPNYPYCEN